MVAMNRERRHGARTRHELAVMMTALTMLLAGSTRAKPIVDRAHREVRFTATVQPSAMRRPFGVEGHHAIVWKKGKSHWWALFAADESDHDVRTALDSLGARRGENLTPDAWNQRDDPRSPEPDKRVEGTPVDVFVEWNRVRKPLAALLREEKHAAPQLDFRYGGNERYQAEFQSGCIVCLYSCPGGAVGNHAHPIRDYVRDGAVYTAIENNLPPAGTKVTIILKPRLEER
jgi:hypothetical protein